MTVPVVLTSRKSTGQAERKGQVRYLARMDLYALARNLCGYDKMTPGFHGPLCRFAMGAAFPKNLYLLPRDHFKTSVLTIALNIQRLLRNPEARILIASNKAENAEAMLTELKGHLMNPELVWAFPDLLWPDPKRQAEQWTMGAITIKRKRRTKEASVETIGVEGEVTSKHYDHGTFDDLVGFENSQTKEQLRRVIAWRRTAESLFEPQATTDDVGTPWAYGDLAAWWLEQKVRHGMALGVYRQPCWQTTHPGELRVDAQGGVVDDFLRDPAGRLQPAFPERFTLAKLEERRKAVGGPTFAAQYRLNPVDDETAVFPRSKAKVVARGTVPPPGELWCVMAVDPAISIKEWADYSALAVVGFDSHGYCWVLDLRRGRWAESEMVNQIYDAWGRWPGIRAIGFEAIGFAKIYRREFTRAGETRGYLPITALERDTKVTKNSRIRSLEPLWASGELLLAEDLQALDEFLDEAERFRVYRESVHDDMLDALADCLQLRVRPSGERTKPESLIDDPEALERQEWEHAAQEARRRTGQPELDRSALRVGYGLHRYYRQRDQEREAAVLGAGVGEFFG